MPTNKQRREAARRHLERQLERRQQRDVARKRFTLWASVGGTVLGVAVVVVLVLVLGSGSSKKAADNPTVSSPTTTPTATDSTTAPAAPLPAEACAKPTGAATATFAGLTISSATDLSHEPKVSGKSATPPTALQCMDLVVGKGKVATTASQATVQYVGVLYATGTVFQSSWATKPAPQFGLAPGSVITGFSQGIAGAGKVTAMHAGGRRVLILPAALAYGAQSQNGIPANSALVFVVDLQAVS